MDVAMTGFMPQLDVGKLGLGTKMGGIEAGMGFGGQQMNDLMNTINAALGAGGQQRGITGELMAEPYGKWQMSQPYANPWLQMLSTALGTQPFSYMGMPGQSGMLDYASKGFGSTLGTAGAGAALGAAIPGMSAGAGAILPFLSDRRLKKNIIYLPATLASIPLTLFQYLWDTVAWHIGVIAQDALRRRPDAVLFTPLGLAVDYSRLL